jgi:flagellin
MALTIQTNVFSLNAQRNLRRVENPLQTSLQRLSSGYRINSARDDAAGFAITTRQTTQIRGLSQAIRNSNDGVSFAQTAEGAMDEMITALQRVNELSVQSASNNTATDRSSINEEVTQLVAELNRIVSQTRFNGETFLNKQKSINVQVGTNVNELINVSSANVSPTTLGVSTTYSSTLGASDVAGAALQVYLSSGLANGATLDGVSLGDAIVASDTLNNSSVLIDRLNDKSGDTGVTAFSFGNALVSSAALTVDTGSNSTVVDSGYITVNGITVGSFTVTSQASVSITNLASAINAKSNSTGVTASVVISSTGATERLVLSNTTGAGISVSVDTNVTNATSITANPFASGSQSVDANQNGKIILNGGISKTSLAVDGAQSTRAIFGATPSDGVSVSLTKNTINDLNVSTAGGANVAILAVQTALDTISAQKAKLGATQNRLATTVSNLDNVRENASAARSRIRDADFAEESANLTKNLLIQQAGISILSQANGLTQNVLALLQ